MRELLADIADWWDCRPYNWLFRPVETWRYRACEAPPKSAPVDCGSYVMLVTDEDDEGSELTPEQKAEWLAHFQREALRVDYVTPQTLQNDTVH